MPYRNPDDRRAHFRRYNRQRRARLKTLRICGTCMTAALAPGWPYSQCPACKARDSENHAGLYQERLAAHACVHCGRQMAADWHYVECAACKVPRRGYG